MTMKGGTVLDTVKMLACMLVGCNIGLQWSINGFLIETFPSCSGIESRRGCGSKLGDETRLMTMKGGTVLDTVKMLACMLAGCNIGLQWSINGVLIETFPSCSGIKSRSGCGSTLGDETRLMTMKGGTVLDSLKCLHACWGAVTLGCNGVLMEF